MPAPTTALLRGASLFFWTRDIAHFLQTRQHIVLGLPTTGDESPSNRRTPTPSHLTRWALFRKIGDELQSGQVATQISPTAETGAVQTRCFERYYLFCWKQPLFSRGSHLNLGQLVQTWLVDEIANSITLNPGVCSNNVLLHASRWRDRRCPLTPATEYWRAVDAFGKLA